MFWQKNCILSHFKTQIKSAMELIFSMNFFRPITYLMFLLERSLYWNGTTVFFEFLFAVQFSYRIAPWNINVFAVFVRNPFDFGNLNDFAFSYRKRNCTTFVSILNTRWALFYILSFTVVFIFIDDLFFVMFFANMFLF